MTAMKRLLTSVALSVLLTGSPMALGAATVKECTCGKPTATSYTWNFYREANILFARVQADTQQIVDHAELLQSNSDDPTLGWQENIGQLRSLKTEIDDIAQKLCRLETIRRVVAPWQQKTIDQIASNVPLMVDNAQDAIVFVNGHREDLMNPTYWRYADNLYSEASNLSRFIGDAVQDAKVLGE